MNAGLRLKSARSLGVGVGSLLAAEGLDHVDEPPVVLNPPLSPASLLFLLLLGLNLGGLTTHLTSTGKRTVHLTSEKGDVQVDGVVFQGSEVNLVLKRSSGAEQIKLLDINALQQGELSLQTLNISLGGHIEDVGLGTTNDQLHD